MDGANTHWHCCEISHGILKRLVGGLNCRSDKIVVSNIFRTFVLLFAIALPCVWNQSITW